MNTFDFDRVVRDPAIFAEGRLPAHSDHVAYRTAGELRMGKSSLRMPLDGLWRFHYARSLAEAPVDFPNVDSTGWSTIRVPAHVQMEGWGVRARLQQLPVPLGRHRGLKTRRSPDVLQPCHGLCDHLHPARELPRGRGQHLLPGRGERLCRLAQRNIHRLQ